MADLRDSTAQLNQRLDAVHALFHDQYAGLTADVLLPDDTNPNRVLIWKRCKVEWQLVVGVAPDHDGVFQHEMPLRSAPRTLRIAAVQAIPALCRALEAERREMIDELDAACAALDAFLQEQQR